MRTKIRTECIWVCVLKASSSEQIWRAAKARSTCASPLLIFLTKANLASWANFEEKSILVQIDDYQTARRANTDYRWYRASVSARIRSSFLHDLGLVNDILNVNMTLGDCNLFCRKDEKTSIRILTDSENGFVDQGTTVWDVKSTRQWKCFIGTAGLNSLNKIPNDELIVEFILLSSQHNVNCHKSDPTWIILVIRRPTWIRWMLLEHP